MPEQSPTTNNLNGFHSILHHIRIFFTLPPRKIAKLFEQTYAEWNKDHAPRLGAALAYYTIFSLAPLLVVVIAVAGLAFGPAAARGQVVWQIQDLVGRQGAEAIQTMLEAAWAPANGIIATVISLFTLFLGASLVVSELRNSLNEIWNVPAQQGTEGVIAGIVELFRQRLYSFLL